MRGSPVLGVCLGAQLLAASLGAAVYTGGRPEVGIADDVEVTRDGARDRVFGAVPSRLTTRRWHEDTFDLPRGARLLASSPAYPNQAFAWRRAYDLQFHLEMTAELGTSWAAVPTYAFALAAAARLGGSAGARRRAARTRSRARARSRPVRALDRGGGRRRRRDAGQPGSDAE